MHSGRIQRIVAVMMRRNPRLLERLGAQPRHLLQRLRDLNAPFGSRCWTMFAPDLTEARHARQQRHRGGVDVDADRIDAILDHRIERARELCLRRVVLILADADGLGIDLDEFGQRILQPPPIETAPRSVTSRSGSSSEAKAEAE